MSPTFRHLLLLTLAGVLAAGNAWAKQPEPRDSRQRSDDARGNNGNGDNSGGNGSGNNGRSNLPESVRRVERQTGGEVLRAEPMQRDGREVYRVKVLTSDGRVRVIQDDPREQRRSDGAPRSASRDRQRSVEPTDQASDDSDVPG